MSDADAIVARQRALEKTAGEALPDVLEAFERGFDDGRRCMRPIPFRASHSSAFAAAYANGFFLGRLNFD